MSATETLWGVGTWIDGDGARQPLEVSHGDIQRDTASASRTLTELGVTAGMRVLWCSMLSEAVQIWPFVLATMIAGAQLSCAEASEGEAARVAMFTRLIGYDAVIGVTAAILDGLEGLGHDLGDVFAGVAVLGAWPDAYGRLHAADMKPRHFALVGPAVALAREPGASALVDGDEWTINLVDGHVAVTANRERATPFAHTVTAVRARSIHDNEITLT
jgi:hypothetical protein